MEKIKKIISEYRNKNVAGKIVDLSPVTEKDLPEIVRLRNTPKMMYYFNQSYELTVESQLEWYKKYLQRDDDLYWTIKDKSGKIIGTNRLYDVTPDKCEQGSLMVDENYSMTAPYAAEAIMLSLDFAFDVLGVNAIINDNRHDNKNMNSITKKFGFTFLREIDIRGVTYYYYELYRENYKKTAVEEIIKLWLDR